MSSTLFVLFVIYICIFFSVSFFSSQLSFALISHVCLMKDGGIKRQFFDRSNINFKRSHIILSLHYSITCFYKWMESESERGEYKKREKEDYQSKGFTSTQITVHLLIKHTISRLCIWQASHGSSRLKLFDSIILFLLFFISLLFSTSFTNAIIASLTLSAQSSVEGCFCCRK